MVRFHITLEGLYEEDIVSKSYHDIVQCSHSSFSPRPLSSILSLETHAITTAKGTPCTLPFQNIKSRATVRIIDFFPSNLADFAVPCRQASEYDVLSEMEDKDSEHQEYNSLDEKNANENTVANEQRWEWRFGLVLEDAMGSKNEEKAIMTVYIADQDAEFLLKLDAQE